ncbi:MAG: DUF4249 domain-containing protein [Bacteroidota bacterium]|nr:DUF4249 domain-containing protein [Bacteroidota bacterium]
MSTVRSLIPLLLCIVLGCEGPVEFPGYPYQPKLVVTSEFSAQSAWHAVLQRTVGFDEVVSFPVGVEHATIAVTGDDGSQVELMHKGGGFYQAGCCRPKPGVTYQMVVRADGFVQATASDRLPATVPIDVVRRTTVVREGRPTARLEIDFQDARGVRNYYELSVLLDVRWLPVGFTVLNVEVQDQLQDYGVGDFIEPDLAAIFVRRVLLHDDGFDGKAYTLILEVDPFHSVEEIGGPLSVKLRTVSEAYYQYRRSQLLQENLSVDPFAEPVTIRSNVMGGHGVFAGYAPQTHGDLSDTVLLQRIAGPYVLSYFDVRRDGAGFLYVTGGDSGKLELQTDHRVLGELQIPLNNGEFWSASLDGGFVLSGTSLRLFHSADTALRDMEFEYRPEYSTLNGNIAIDFGEYVAVEFKKADTQPTPVQQRPVSLSGSTPRP